MTDPIVSNPEPMEVPPRVLEDQPIVTDDLPVVEVPPTPPTVGTGVDDV
jgi:hypothetical protein